MMWSCRMAAIVLPGLVSFDLYDVTFLFTAISLLSHQLFSILSLGYVQLCFSTQMVSVSALPLLPVCW